MIRQTHNVKDSRKRKRLGTLASVKKVGKKVQGKDAEGAREVLRDALALEEAGAFAILLEAIPKELGAYITQRLRIPTIGIGAGPGTSGQVRYLIVFKTLSYRF